jgi:hypothetical protein
MSDLFNPVVSQFLSANWNQMITMQFTDDNGGGCAASAQRDSAVNSNRLVKRGALSFPPSPSLKLKKITQTFLSLILQTLSSFQVQDDGHGLDIRLSP